MFFSEYFQVSSDLVQEYGAIDISLVCDVPLFVDPILIYNNNKKEYKKLHQSIIKYFKFLLIKAEKDLSVKKIETWFSFSEIYNNWLGYSLAGNKGLALGIDYAKFLYNNIGSAFAENNISESKHIEKVMIFDEKSGKDKISDLTVNLIKDFLLEYTEKFTLNHIDSNLCKDIYVDKAYFDYDTEEFVGKKYTLPFIYNENGNIEYVMLTPADILREGEPSINRRDFLNNHARIRASIDDVSLRNIVNDHIVREVKEYQDRQKQNNISERGINRIEKRAFEEITKQYPQLYDYYIRLRETDTDDIKLECENERNQQLERLFVNASGLIDLFLDQGYKIDTSLTAKEEAKKRTVFLKHIIENCGGYRNLYTQESRITREDDLKRLLKLVWQKVTNKTKDKFSNENDKGLEFKLASNPQLDKIFTKKIYKEPDCLEGSVVAIFYFTQDEYERTLEIINETNHKEYIDKGIFLIDCRDD